MNAPYFDKALEWANNQYFDVEDRNELKALIESENHKELEERFYQELEFGTGGLRNLIAFGSNRINKYTIRKAAQAMATIIKQKFPKEKRLICVGYDCRLFSDLFAKEAADVFVANGINVKLFSELSAVPVLSYSIKYFEACAGVMITASHNPAQYNGLKAYWSDASQVTPPIDNIIIDEYKNISSWESILTENNTDSTIESCGEEVFSSYSKMIQDNVCRPELFKENGNKLNVIYTPLHGTGYPAVKSITQSLGLRSFKVVEEQAQPDSAFPTVSMPNPEQPAALKMATDIMLKEKADLVLGSDPDTDRLGVAYLQGDEIKYLTGNQIGVLLLDYKLNSLQQSSTLPSNALIIKTIVTTELQTQIANHYNVRIENTLTGFKWMGKKMRQMRQAGESFKFIFGNEESFGYLTHDNIADKDGVDALILMCECALFHKLQNKTLGDALEDIYEKYGYFQESLLCLQYPGREGKKTMNLIMEKFRSSQLESFIGLKITKKIDLLDHPDFPRSNVLGIFLEDGNCFWVRPSGTEPKVKFYTMYMPEDKKDFQSKKIEANNFISNIEQEFSSLSKEV